jgi:hypothetical protein
MSAPAGHADVAVQLLSCMSNTQPKLNRDEAVTEVLNMLLDLCADRALIMIPCRPQGS